MKLQKFLQRRPAFYGGLDVSLKGISSLVLVTAKNGIVHVIPSFWIPEGAMALKPHGEILRQFVVDGHVQTVPGNVVHYEFIADQLVQQRQDFNIKAVAFDRWGASVIFLTLDKRRVKVIQFGQGFASMSTPMKGFDDLVSTGMITWDNNPVLNWMIGNLKVHTDIAGNIKPDKSKSTGPIGGTIALFMAIGLWISHS